MQIALPGDQNWNQCKFLAGKITQVKEAIPWFRCASGNVLKLFGISTSVQPKSLNRAIFLKNSDVDNFSDP